MLRLVTCDGTVGSQTRVYCGSTGLGLTLVTFFVKARDSVVVVSFAFTSQRHAVIRQCALHAFMC